MLWLDFGIQSAVSYLQFSSADSNLSPCRSAHASRACCLEGDGELGGASSEEELVVVVTVVDGVDDEDPITKSELPSLS